MENLLQTIEEGICPRFNYIPLLSEEATNILKNSLKINVNYWKEDVIKLIINDQSYEIPRIITSRGIFDYLGINKSQFQKLWNLVKQVDTKVGPLSPIRKFNQRITRYLDDIINSISLRNQDGQLKSSTEILDTNRFTNDVQSQQIELTNLPRLDKPVRIIQFRKINPIYVPDLARKYIIFRWAFLQKMDELILDQKERW